MPNPAANWMAPLAAGASFGQACCSVPSSEAGGSPPFFFTKIEDLKRMDFSPRRISRPKIRPIYPRKKIKFW